MVNLSLLNNHAPRIVFKAVTVVEAEVEVVIPSAPVAEPLSSVAGSKIHTRTFW